MRNWIVVVLLFLSSNIFAQKNQYGSLNIISNQGIAFFLYVNGVKTNQKPQSKVRIEKLLRRSYILKIELDNNSHTVLNRKSIFVNKKSGEMLNVTFELLKTLDSLQLNFISLSDANTIISIPENMFVYDFDSKQELNINNNIIADTALKANQTIFIKKDSIIKQKITISETNSNLSSAISIREPENWICQNEWPMWKLEYETALKNIRAEKLDDQKLKIARALATKSCMKSEQVAEIGLLLINDANKLDFTKFAFNHTIDFKNYLKVEMIFTEDQSKVAFEKFITL